MTYATNNNCLSVIENGFTIVELLVVISILSLVALPSIVGYVSYTNAQNVNNAALDLKNILLTAQSRALSEVQTTIAACNASTSGLTDYEVHFCNGVTNNTCQNADAYELYVSCKNVASPQHITGYDKKLPTGVTISSPPTNPISFDALTGKVTNGTSILVTRGSVQKTIQVQSNGVITVQ